MTTLTKIVKEVAAIKKRSKWGMAVRRYMLDLLDDLYEWYERDKSFREGPKRSDRWLEEKCPSPKEFERVCLNGASDWNQYSWAGCSLVYNDDLAERLCTESELKRLGWKRDNDGRLYGGRSEWTNNGVETHLLDRQAAALRTAYNELRVMIYERTL